MIRSDHDYPQRIVVGPSPQRMLGGHERIATVGIVHKRGHEYNFTFACFLAPTFIA